MRKTAQDAAFQVGAAVPARAAAQAPAQALQVAQVPLPPATQAHPAPAHLLHLPHHPHLAQAASGTTTGDAHAPSPNQPKRMTGTDVVGAPHLNQLKCTWADLPEM